jgi:antitoxin HigA-1
MRNESVSEHIDLIHPGETLLSEFLKPLNISQSRLAAAIGVSRRHINEIVLGRRRIGAETSIKLGLFFDMSPNFWLNMQTSYDMHVAAGKPVKVNSTLRELQKTGSVSA